MDEAEKLYKNKTKHKVVISKTYVNCPKCNAINKPVLEELIYEDESGKYYRIKCCSCKEEFCT